MPSSKRLLVLALPVLLVSSACHAGPAAAETKVYSGPRGNSSGGAMHINDNPYEGSGPSTQGQTSSYKNEGPAEGVQSYGIEDNPYDGHSSFGGGGMNGNEGAGEGPAQGAQSEGMGNYGDSGADQNSTQDVANSTSSDQDQQDQDSGGGDDDPDSGDMPNPEDSYGGGNPWSRQVNKGQQKAVNVNAARSGKVREYTPADTSLKLNARVKGYTPPDVGKAQKVAPKAEQ